MRAKPEFARCEHRDHVRVNDVFRPAPRAIKIGWAGSPYPSRRSAHFPRKAPSASKILFLGLSLAAARAGRGRHPAAPVHGQAHHFWPGSPPAAFVVPFSPSGLVSGARPSQRPSFMLAEPRHGRACGALRPRGPAPCKARPFFALARRCVSFALAGGRGLLGFHVLAIVWRWFRWGGASSPVRAGGGGPRTYRTQRAWPHPRTHCHRQWSDRGGDPPARWWAWALERDASTRAWLLRMGAVRAWPGPPCIGAMRVRANSACSPPPEGRRGGLSEPFSTYGCLTPRILRRIRLTRIHAVGWDLGAGQSDPGPRSLVAGFSEATATSSSATADPGLLAVGVPLITKLFPSLWAGGLVRRLRTWCVKSLAQGLANSCLAERCHVWVVTKAARPALLWWAAVHRPSVRPFRRC